MPSRNRVPITVRIQPFVDPTADGARDRVLNLLADFLAGTAIDEARAELGAHDARHGGLDEHDRRDLSALGAGVFA